VAEFNHERKPGTAAHLGSSGRVSVTTRDGKFGEGLFFFFLKIKVGEELQQQIGMFTPFAGAIKPSRWQASISDSVLWQSATIQYAVSRPTAAAFAWLSTAIQWSCTRHYQSFGSVVWQSAIIR